MVTIYEASIPNRGTQQHRKKWVFTWLQGLGNCSKKAGCDDQGMETMDWELSKQREKLSIVLGTWHSVWKHPVAL